MSLSSFTTSKGLIPCSATTCNGVGMVNSISQGPGILVSQPTQGSYQITNNGVISLIEGLNINIEPDTLNPGAFTITAENNGVLGLTEGEGITIMETGQGTQVYEITNDGVLGINAGNGIQINEPTSQHFQVINTGVTQINAGANITITPESPGVFTIASSGGGGGGFTPEYVDSVASISAFPAEPTPGQSEMIPILDPYVSQGITDNGDGSFGLTAGAKYLVSATYYVASIAGSGRYSYIYLQCGNIDDGPLEIVGPTSLVVVDANHLQQGNFTCIIDTTQITEGIEPTLSAWFFSSDGNSQLVTTPAPVAGADACNAFELVVTRIA